MSSNTSSNSSASDTSSSSGRATPLIKIPAILGRLDPPANRERVSLRPSTDDRGVTIHIRDFPALPPVVPKNTWIVTIESWMRQYSDLKYGDIDTRFVSDDLRWTKKEKNALNNRRRREVRERYHVRDWSGRYADCVTKTLLEFVEDLSPEQVAHNTSWVVTPTGIHPPGLPTCKYPLDSYLEDGAPHTASKEIQNALELLTKLNKKARRQGKTNWRHLPEKDLPPRWFSRLAGTRKRKIEPDENEPEDDSQVVTRGQSAYSGDSDADSGLRRLAVQASRIDETEHQAEEEEDSHTKELVDSGASETDGTEYQAEEEENNQAGVTDRASSLDVSQAYDGFKALTDDWASKHDETGHHSADEGGESSLTRRKRRKIESMNLVVLGLAE